MCITGHTHADPAIFILRAIQSLLFSITAPQLRNKKPKLLISLCIAILLEIKRHRPHYGNESKFASVKIRKTFPLLGGDIQMYQHLLGAEIQRGSCKGGETTAGRDLKVFVDQCQVPHLGEDELGKNWTNQNGCFSPWK